MKCSWGGETCQKLKARSVGVDNGVGGRWEGRKGAGAEAGLIRCRRARVLVS